MSERIQCLILSTLVCTLAFVSMAVAQQVTIMDRAKVGNGPALRSGTCQVQVVKNQDSAEALFYREGDLWLRAPVTLVEETKKARHTEIHSKELNGETVITKIRLQGSKESLVFELDIPKGE
ncbi:MAG: hypothetical protein WAO35_06730 [Terriglobia bacterium]